MVSVPAFRRDEALSRLRSNTYDIVVVGAGMTGAGVAVDAAARGLSVALVDAGDIATGTSSKSSKMVHGGLRYLQQKEFRLVYENLRERQRLLENAPHLVRVLPFLIPLFGKNGVVSKTVSRSYATALRIYDWTGGWRIGHRFERLDKAQTLLHLPTLNTDRLVAGFLYFDARGDDARVALTLAKTAAIDLGADVATYVKVMGIEHDAAGKVVSVTCHNEVDDNVFSIAARVVVNATGVWADEIFTMAEGVDSHRITPAKGVHVSVPAQRLPADVAAVFTVPGDRRSIFVVPFEEADYTYVGTTDTAYEGSLDEPLCTSDDVEYLLRAVNASTSSALTPNDITGVWAGLRPLLSPEPGKELSERTADLSRRHQVTASSDGVVHVTGGKWTTYREMAEDAVDATSAFLPSLRRCSTKNLSLHGAPKSDSWQPTTPLETHLYQRYGTDATSVLSLINQSEELATPLITGLPYCQAEFVYSAQEEMVITLIDLLTRRTRAHLQNARATYRAASKVARLVAPYLGWDETRIEKEVADYRALVEKEFGAAGLVIQDENA
jgi:glycerol-3-phosphate dehydrogenase